MHHFTVGEALEGKVSPLQQGVRIYLFYEGNEVIYIGQSASPYERIDNHLGLDWRQSPSQVGQYVLAHTPSSHEWGIEVYTLDDCRDMMLAYFNEIGLPDVRGDGYQLPLQSVDFAERAMIAYYHPRLNTHHNSERNVNVINRQDAVALAREILAEDTYDVQLVFPVDGTIGTTNEVPWNIRIFNNATSETLIITCRQDWEEIQPRPR